MYWVCGGLTSLNLDRTQLKQVGIELDQVRTTAEAHTGFEQGFKIQCLPVAEALHFIPTPFTWQNVRGSISLAGGLQLRIVGIPFGLRASNFRLTYDQGYCLSAQITVLGQVILFDVVQVDLAFDPSPQIIQVRKFTLTLAKEVAEILAVRTGKNLTGTIVGQGRASFEAKPVLS